MSKKVITLEKLNRFWTKVKTYLGQYILKTDIVNTFTSTDSSKVAAATTVKTLKDEINQLNTKLKPYTRIFASTDLVGTGIIEDIPEYNDFIVMVSASGFITAHNVSKECLLDGPIFTSSYYYNEAQHGMATIQLYAGGAYQIAQGLDQNSVDSSVAIYAR